MRAKDLQDLENAKAVWGDHAKCYWCIRVRPCPCEGNECKCECGDCSPLRPEDVGA